MIHNKDELANINNAVFHFLGEELTQQDLSTEGSITIFLSKLKTQLETNALNRGVIESILRPFETRIEDFERLKKTIKYKKLKLRGTKNGIQTEWKGFEAKVFSVLALINVIREQPLIINQLNEFKDSDRRRVSTAIIDFMQERYKQHYYSSTLLVDTASKCKPCAAIKARIQSVTDKVRRL